MLKTNLDYVNWGVYKIINTINNKIYVGSSKNIKIRFSTHKRNLKKNNHQNKHLQRAWNKYGSENFKFEILENCNNLIEKEQYYIDTLKPEYNICKIAYSTLGRKISDEEKIKRRSAANNKIIYQYSLNGNLLNKWFSVSDAARFFNCSSSQIIDVANLNRKTCKGFYWSYNNKFKFIVPKTGKYTYKSIIAINKLTKEIKIFKSIKIAANYVGGNSSNISFCIKNNKKSYKKYYWKVKKY